jgi:hypothetical protein
VATDEAAGPGHPDPTISQVLHARSFPNPSRRCYKGDRGATS